MKTLRRVVLQLLLIVASFAAKAQFTFSTNNGTLTITSCTSTNPVVIIPGSTNGLPIISIGNGAFYERWGLASVTIPNTVTNIGNDAFEYCNSLTNVTIGTNVANIGVSAFYSCTELPSITVPNAVTNIGDDAFGYCDSLTNIVIPNGVTTIGQLAFEYSRLTSVVIPNSVTSIGGDAFFDIPLTNLMIGNGVTNIGSRAFQYCYNLTNVCFEGNPPSRNTSAFANDTNAIGYYLPGTTGWGTNYDGIPMVLWNPQAQTMDGNFGVRTNCFGFDITASTNVPIAVQVSTNLTGRSWTTLQSCTVTNGSIYFSDPGWASRPSSYYRIASP